LISISLYTTVDKYYRLVFLAPVMVMANWADVNLLEVEKGALDVRPWQAGWHS
jgi:hypothetical protein